MSRRRFQSYATISCRSARGSCARRPLHHATASPRASSHVRGNMSRPTAIEFSRLSDIQPVHLHTNRIMSFSGLLHVPPAFESCHVTITKAKIAIAFQERFKSLRVNSSTSERDQTFRYVSMQCPWLHCICTVTPQRRPADSRSQATMSIFPICYS